MTVAQVEETVIVLKRRQPFVPFVVELADGSLLQIPNPGLAINGSGAVFFGPDGGLVDFEFKNVRAIRQ
jgi:hypothetical protein